MGTRPEEKTKCIGPIWLNRSMKFDPDYHPTLRDGINFFVPEAVPVISEAMKKYNK